MEYSMETLIQDPITFNALQALAIMIGGVIVAKTISWMLFRAMRSLGIEREERTRKTATSFRRGVEIIIIVLAFFWALSVLDIALAQNVLKDAWMLLPKMIAASLIFFLGILFVNLIVDVLEVILKSAGFGEHVADMGVTPDVLEAAFKLIKIFLWLIILNIALENIGVPVGIMENTLNAISLAVVFLCAALAFYTIKDIVANMFISSYVRSNLLKPGQKVRFENVRGEVKRVMPFGVLIKTDAGYNMIIPNQQIIKERILIRRSRIEIEDLRSLREKYIAQRPSYCGPASAQMLLSFFGYDITQEEIGKLSGTKRPGGTGPRSLIRAVETLTKKKVKGALIRYSEIKNLKDEVRGWLSDGALVILWFRKEAIFPRATSGHYVLCVGVEDDELIVIDPNKREGGVYLVDYRDMEEAMGEWDKTRGYLVFAPRGTTAYWRLSEGLIYSDESLYKELGKSMERQLRKLKRKSIALESIIPESVRAYIKREKESKIKKIWGPDDE